MTDPIADLLTRIRNGLSIESESVTAPFSKLKKTILEVLKKSGFVHDFEVIMKDGRATLRIHLKYGPDGEHVITHIQRVSKPGRRVYRGASELPNPLNGLGIAVLSTSRGVVSHQEARSMKVGGEVLCEVW